MRTLTQVCIVKSMFLFIYLESIENSAFDEINRKHSSLCKKYKVY